MLDGSLIIKIDKMIKKDSYRKLIGNIGLILENGRRRAYDAINQILVETYWRIGQYIVEFEQNGKEKAEYGTKLFDRLSHDLTGRYGRGFSRSNLIYIRLFYLKYPKSETLSHQLSWGHYFEILKIDNDLEREFYEKQCIHEKWSVRELKRQKKTALFYRLALSKDKKGVLKLSKKGQLIETAEDIIKDPYVLEFLKMPENYHFSEKELEQKIIDKLQIFLLEMGRGFSFVARQFRITLDNEHFYVDLVFYHHVLKCFILIDLKINKVNHLDVGQMNMYLNYFKKEEMNVGDNEPIGIILGLDKKNVLIEYALGGISNKLFVSKYQVYLPKKEELQKRLKSVLGKK